MNALLQSITKRVQNTHSASYKPANIPITSVDEMNTFVQIEDDEYFNVVSKKQKFIVITSLSYLLK